jgi:hypothetical protein
LDTPTRQLSLQLSSAELLRAASPLNSPQGMLREDDETEALLSKSLMRSPALPCPPPSDTSLSRPDTDPLLRPPLESQLPKSAGAGAAGSGEFKIELRDGKEVHVPLVIPVLKSKAGAAMQPMRRPGQPSVWQAPAPPVRQNPDEVDFTPGRNDIGSSLLLPLRCLFCPSFVVAASAQS